MKKYNPTTVFSLDRDWFPQSGNLNSEDWVQIFIPAWRNEAEIHPGSTPLDIHDMRDFISMCEEVLEYMEKRAGEEGGEDAED